MRHLTFLSFVLLFGCVDAFNGDFTSEGSDRIVVTGSITNNAIPEVRVYTSVPFSEATKTPPFISESSVWIEDHFGTRYPMEVINDTRIRENHFFVNEDPDNQSPNFWEEFWDIDTVLQIVQSNYRYQTVDKSFRGQVGTTYTLKIMLPNGRYYTSTPQLLKASSPIKNAYAEYVNLKRVNALGNEENDPKWNIFIEPEKSEENDVHLTWRYKGVYEFETFPEEYCDQPDNDCDPGPAHPRVVPPGCCKYCYVTEYGQNIPTSSLQSATRKKVASIPITHAKVYNYYKLDIYQLSISREAHDYLQIINQQITGQGTIFDPTPSPIIGNIYDGDNPDNKTLGMFYAAGVSTTQLILSNQDADIKFISSSIPNDCRLIKNSSDQKPDDYISGKVNQCYHWWIDSWQDCDQCYDVARGTWSKCPDWEEG
ncbi:MAG: DUF4249 family protein [Bacteroidota bacterium]